MRDEYCRCEPDAEAAARRASVHAQHGDARPHPLRAGDSLTIMGAERVSFIPWLFAGDCTLGCAVRIISFPRTFCVVDVLVINLIVLTYIHYFRVELFLATLRHSIG
jgi:hypothetical protein